MAQFQLSNYSADKRTCVAIGVFDGVHLGHQSVLKQCSDAAANDHLKRVCLTFNPHPLEVLAPDHAPSYICSLSQRIDFLLDSGWVDDVVLIDFTRETANLSPQEFVQQVLVDSLRAAKVCVGADFRYGKKRAGSVMDLESAGEADGFGVNIVHAVAMDGQRISSTSVRQAIESGDIPLANKLLGRQFALRGTVAHGKRLGRTIGFPTINLKLESTRQLLPSDGVYSGYSIVPGADKPIRSAISVGTNPTTDSDSTRKVEAFLLDGFDREIYDLPVDISFASKLRGQETYPDLESLIAQIKRDVETIETSLRKL